MFKKIIRFLLGRWDRPKSGDNVVEVRQATFDEKMSRIKEALARTAASQERAMKLLEGLDKGDHGQT